MRGSSILVTSNPKGVFLEGTVSGTPVPGTVMEVKAATAIANGWPTWQARSAASGAKGGIFVLLPDDGQGQLYSTAYVTSTRCFLYAPIMGEQLNMSVNDVAGTGDDVAIGDLFGVEQTTGQLKADSSYTSAPFRALESITDPTADYWLWCLYLGNNA